MDAWIHGWMDTRTDRGETLKLVGARQTMEWTVVMVWT
jgi:hypothetical protein